MDSSYVPTLFEAFSVKEISPNGYLARTYPKIRDYGQLSEQVYSCFANNLLIISITDFDRFKTPNKSEYEKAIFVCFRFDDENHTGAFTYIRFEPDKFEAYLRGEWEIEANPIDFGTGIPLLDIENMPFMTYIRRIEDYDPQNPVRIMIATPFAKGVFEDKIIKVEELEDV
jgi:hypothetical protein